MSTRKHYFIERRDDGQYAVTATGAERASALTNTQKQAIKAAKTFNPDDHPDVERVRHTEAGVPDKWRPANS